MRSKRCFKCCEVLPLDAFYTHPRMADGHLGKCKECTKKDSRAIDPKKRQAYDKRRMQTPKRIAQHRRATRLYRERHPEKAKAHAAVAYALSTGKLHRRGCEFCGSRAQAHHEDYSKPLDVRWLCKQHHDEQHRALTRVNAP